MNQFLQRLQSIKKIKLAEYTQFLVLQEKNSLESLESQVAQLQATIDRTSRTAKSQREAKNAFDSEIQARFALETHRQALLQLFWHEISVKHFEKESVIKNWLTEQLNKLTEQGLLTEGEVRAGSSYDLLKKSTLPKSVSVKKDSAISEHGFVFEGKNNLVDCLVSTYLAEKYKAHRADLYAIAFSADKVEKTENGLESKKKNTPKIK